MPDSGHHSSCWSGQPGSAWVSLGQPGSAWVSLGQPGSAWVSLVRLGQPGSAWVSLVSLGQPGSALVSLGQSGLAWSSTTPALLYILYKILLVYLITCAAKINPKYQTRLSWLICRTFCYKNRGILSSVYTTDVCGCRLLNNFSLSDSYQCLVLY